MACHQLGVGGHVACGRAHGHDCTSAHRHRICTLWVDFVDDADLFCTAENSATEAEFIVVQIQEAMLTWHDGLGCSGGALKPSKCSWGLIDFIWANGAWRCATEEDAPACTRVPDLEGQMTTTKRNAPDEAVEVLGFWQALDGNMETQKAVLIEIVKQWGEAMKATWCPRPTAWMGLRSIMWKSLQCVLQATTFTKKEGCEIVQPLHFVIINTLGAARNFPMEFRFCPKKFLGLEMPHPCIEQGILMTCVTVKHAPLLFH